MFDLRNMSIYHIQLQNFACNWFGLLFVDYTRMFVVLKARKHCFPMGFLFQEGFDVVLYPTAPE
jgi:high-affinity nickel permease